MGMSECLPDRVASPILGLDLGADCQFRVTVFGPVETQAILNDLFRIDGHHRIPLRRLQYCRLNPVCVCAKPARPCLPPKLFFELWDPSDLIQQDGRCIVAGTRCSPLLGSDASPATMADRALVVLSSTNSFSLARLSSLFAFFSAFLFALFTSKLSSSSPASDGVPLFSPVLLGTRSPDFKGVTTSVGFTVSCTAVFSLALVDSEDTAVGASLLFG